MTFANIGTMAAGINSKTPPTVVLCIMCGMNGNDIVPLKVDASGRVVHLISDVEEV